MEFKVSEENFNLSGRDFFVLSGEIHYFRIKPETWLTHLKKAKQANLNTISTYIPWDWHEYVEGRFDFTGETNPQRNLIGFIELCKKNGLFLIVRPGPYILAEYLDYGIPKWLISSHPEILSLNREGKPFGHARITLMHPTCLKYVRLWYDKVLEIVKENSIGKSGGAITALQLCNETGLFDWIENDADHNPAALELYRKFLSEKYKKITRLNASYKTKYKSFTSVAPASGDTAKLSELASLLDWHLFWRSYYAMYFEYLVKEVVKKQIHLPLIYNMPGWAFGRAVDYPLNITRYEELAKLYPKAIAALDHIPENLSYRNFHDVAVVQQMTRAIQSGKGPLFVAEMQAGSKDHNIITYADELELFYKASLAYGAAGINFYMFSQGKNPKNKSAIGPTFYWQTPLDYDAKEQPLYPVIKRFGKLAGSFGTMISKAKPDSKVAVLFYKPYYYTEFARCYDLDRMGLGFNPKTVMEKILFEGIAKALNILNCDYDILDLGSCKPKDLAKYKQVWAVSLEYMDAPSQKLLHQYVLNGGHLIIMPRLPRYDLSLKPCNILWQALKMTEEKEVYLRSSTIEFMDVKEIAVINPIQIFNEPNAQPVALLGDGSVCGIIKRIGGGFALIMGTAFGYSIEEHLYAYSKVLKLDNIRGNANSTNSRIFTQEFFGTDYAFLFAANYNRTAEEGSLMFLSPATKSEIRMPYGSTLVLPPMSGLLIPIDVPIQGSKARIAFSTSQVLNAFEKGGSIYVELYGYPVSEGQVAISINKRPKNAFLDGKKVEFSYRAGQFILNYKHKDEGSILLKMNLA